MDTRELKSLYYGLLANDPDYPAWEEFEWYDPIEMAWCRYAGEIRNNNFDNYQIRHNPKPKQWSPPVGKYAINLEYNVISDIDEDNAKYFIKNGLSRSSKEQAEQDLAQIRQFCRFLAWRAENCCYTNAILPALDYVGCFLNNEDYCKLKELIDSGEVEL